MNSQLPDLPAKKLKEIESIKQVIIDFVNPDKIILYGSYAKGKQVEQIKIIDGIRYFYISDYDLIVITDETKIKEFELANELEARLKSKSDINFQMYDIKYINKELRDGNYFFVPVYLGGVLLHDAGKTKLVKPGKLSIERIHLNAQGYYDFWMNNSDRFYKHAQIEIEEVLKGGSRSGFAVWFLFQTVESLYSSIMLVFMGIKPKLHNLNKYRNSVTKLSEELDAIFPIVKDRNERRIFDLLNRAYIGGKYKMDFEVPIDDIKVLNERIGRMILITDKLCLDRIANLKISIPQK
jgi:predicted nucleotidyltransferase